MSETLNLDKFKLKIVSWINSSRFCMKLVVTNTSLNDSYPENFFCILPKNFAKASENKLIKLLGVEKSKKLAKKLLSEALKSEIDENIKSQIKRRLKELEERPKPTRR